MCVRTILRFVSRGSRAHPNPCAGWPVPPSSDLLNDPNRLSALHSLSVLDTLADKGLDHLADLVCSLLEAPVALVTLVDRDRQFFKSCLGLPEPWRTNRQTPLSHSFCQHTIYRDDCLAIEVARSHPLVSNNLAIFHLNVVAYLGIPMVTHDDQAVGSLCAIDHDPLREPQRRRHSGNEPRRARRPIRLPVGAPLRHLNGGAILPGPAGRAREHCLRRVPLPTSRTGVDLHRGRRDEPPGRSCGGRDRPQLPRGDSGAGVGGGVGSTTAIGHHRRVDCWNRTRLKQPPCGCDGERRIDPGRTPTRRRPGSGGPSGSGARRSRAHSFAHDVQPQERTQPAARGSGGRGHPGGSDASTDPALQDPG
jgi:hypothetical protein